MPILGEGILEGIIRNVFKKVGDYVETDEVLFQVETDKTLVDIESFQSGVVKACYAQQGDTVKVGDVIIEIALENAQTELYNVDQNKDISDKLINYGLRKGLTIEQLKKIVPKNKKLSILDIEDHINQANKSDLFVFDEGQLSFIANMEKSKQWQNATWVSTKIQVDRLRDSVKEYINVNQSFVSDLQILSYHIAQSGKALDKLKLTCIGEKKYKINEDLTISFAALTDEKALKYFLLPQADKLSFEAFLQEYQKQYSAFMQGQVQNLSKKPSLYISYLGNEGPILAVSSLTFPSIATLFIGRKFIEHDKTYVNLVITFDHNVINGHEAITFLNEIKYKVEPKIEVHNVKSDPSAIDSEKKCLAWLKEMLLKQFGLEVTDDKNLGEQEVDSLKAVQIIDEINRQLSLNLLSTTLWNYPEIKKLSEHVFSKIDKSSDKLDVLSQMNISNILANKVREINES